MCVDVNSKLFINWKKPYYTEELFTLFYGFKNKESEYINFSKKFESAFWPQDWVEPVKILF
jgi:hypothetical protein